MNDDVLNSFVVAPDSFPAGRYHLMSDEVLVAISSSRKINKEKISQQMRTKTTKSESEASRTSRKIYSISQYRVVAALTEVYASDNGTDPQRHGAGVERRLRGHP